MELSLPYDRMAFGNHLSQLKFLIMTQNKQKFIFKTSFFSSVSYLFLTICMLELLGRKYLDNPEKLYPALANVTGVRVLFFSFFGVLQS